MTIVKSTSIESDAALMDSVRRGDVSSYGELYVRHASTVRGLARKLSRSHTEADDLVSEAFAKVLEILISGRGPRSAFRAYLLTTLRHSAYQKTGRDRVIPVEDLLATKGIRTAAVSTPFTDTVLAALERSLVAHALTQLPERWQMVLWHTEIQGKPPADVAALMDLTPNAVSALACRAREGLRQAYLQMHLAHTVERDCRTTVTKLGAWTRNALSAREMARVESHLRFCGPCRGCARELAAVNPRERRTTALDSARNAA